MDYALLVGYGLLALLVASTKPKPDRRRAISGGLPFLVFGALVGWFEWEVARSAVGVGVAMLAPAIPIILYDMGAEMEKKKRRKA